MTTGGASDAARREAAARAEEQGKQAALDGRGPTANPYDRRPGSPVEALARAWERGHRGAEPDDRPQDSNGS